MAHRLFFLQFPVDKCLYVSIAGYCSDQAVKESYDSEEVQTRRDIHSFWRTQRMATMGVAVSCYIAFSCCTLAC